MVRTHSSWMKWAFREKNNAVSYSPIVSYVSFLTSLMQVLKFHFLRLSKGLSFSIKLLASSDIDVEDKFFLHICGKKRLDCNLRLKRENQQTALSVSTLRWKGKNQQNWKESSELKIAPKTKNQYSCRRGCQMYNLACGKVNLEPKWRKLQEKSFELNIAP